MKIPKGCHKVREPCITCSHIWHNNILKCIHSFNTQSVKVRWRYNNSDMNGRQLCIKILKNKAKSKDAP